MNTINFLTILLLVTFSCALRLKQTAFTWERGDPTTLNIEVDAGSSFRIRLPAFSEREWVLENLHYVHMHNMLYPSNIDGDGRHSYIPPRLRIEPKGTMDFTFETFATETANLSFVHYNNFDEADIRLTVNITVK